jgi:TRAP-type C4-dicarboxylate transport system substrate-binding protein
VSYRAAILCLGALLAWTPVRGAERLIYDSPLPQNEYGARLVRAYAAKVLAATKGEVEILVRQNGVLGLTGAETLAAVRDGLVHMADMQMNQQVGEEPIFGIESLPCLARDFDQLKALRGFTRAHFDAAALRHNQKILFIFPLPRQNLYARRDVRDVQALRSLKVRTIDRNATAFFAQLGAVPIQMPFAEVAAALSSGLLDAVSTSSTTAVSGAFWDFLTHAHQMHWQMNSFMATVNLDAWGRIPAELRPVIENIGAETEAELWAAAVATDAGADRTLRDKRLVFSTPDADFERRMLAACARVVDDYRKTAGALENRILDAYLAAVRP